MPRGDPTVVKRIPESLVERLASFAREGESWVDVLDRLVERAEQGRVAEVGRHAPAKRDDAGSTPAPASKPLARREVETRFKK